MADVEDLADGFRVITAMFGKVLRQRHRLGHFFAQTTAESVKSGRGRMRAEHQGEP